jgi:uncharacterized protein YeaO (DUF488 family)
MSISIKRAYDPAQPGDGYRVLVDRLWPRGLSKATLGLDVWMRDVAPSNELRRRFHHEEGKWNEFRKQYFKELEQQPALVRELRQRARRGRLTLIYGARDEIHNNAAALKQYLERRAP